MDARVFGFIGAVGDGVDVWIERVSGQENISIGCEPREDENEKGLAAYSRRLTRIRKTTAQNSAAEQVQMALKSSRLADSG